jgi:hypothetical protein
MKPKLVVAILIIIAVLAIVAVLFLDKLFPTPEATALAVSLGVPS